MRKHRLGALGVLVGILGAIGAAWAATLTASINTAIIASYVGSNDLGSPRQNLTQSLQAAITLSSGTGSGQAQQLFSDTRTLAASATENLDMAGSLVDAFGTTLTFATIKVVKICAAAANTNNVVVGGAGSNTFVGMFSAATDKIAVRPGGCFVWVAPQTGATVTAGTGDILLIANSGAGTSVTYDVILIGT